MAGRRALLAGMALALVFLTAAGAAAPGMTSKVSVGPGGLESNGYSDWPALSAAGRVVAFYSYATNLVPDDTNGVTDVFVHERLTGVTKRVSVSSSGGQANGRSGGQTIDEAGRLVAYASHASNLVEGDRNGAPDVFVHDLRDGTTELVSVATGGEQGAWWSTQPDLDATGRFVAWSSNSRNLVPGDTNELDDIFVRDRVRDLTRRVSFATGGGEANGYSGRPSLSADGRFVAFESAATNLVAGDTNGSRDVFLHDLLNRTTTRVSGGERDSHWPALSADGRMVAFEAAADILVHDRLTAMTTRVSVDSSGVQANGPSHAPSISDDGRFVAFDSWGDNLVPGDTNESWDVFVHDRLLGVTSRVSVDDSRHEADENSHAASITPDGQFVAYSSTASNLPGGDANETFDVYVHGPVVFDPKPPPVPAAKPCRVPRVIGLRLAAAKTRIRHANCALGQVRRIGAQLAGRVLRQTPRPGRTLPYRARVNLVVGTST